MGWCHPTVPVACEGCWGVSTAVRMGDGESGICTAFSGCSFLSATGEAHENVIAQQPNWPWLLFGEDAL